MKGVAILILSFLFFSCEDSPEGKPIPPKMNGHYLGGYLYEVNTIEYLYSSNDFHYISLKGETVDKGNLFDKYAKLCGDTTYASFQESTIALSDTIYSIHVTCNSDFDADHKKDEYLDDIISLQFLSFHEFIKANYDDIQNNIREKDITQINSETLTLIEPTLGVRFLKTPTDKGKYEFTLSITSGNDKTHTIPLHVDFK